MERFIIFATIVLIGVISALKSEAERTPPTQRTPELVKVETADELATLFDEHNFDVDRVRRHNNPVPSVFLASLPKDIKSTTSSNQKKNSFLKTMLPLILEVNKTVMAERRHLMKLKSNVESGIVLSFLDEMWIQEMSERYRVKSGSIDEHIDELLIKVDVIPPSLALAQASLESGWLMSAAARNKNSIFGHMASKKNVEGFNDLYASVETYILNLNRHSAYQELRRLRASMRHKGQPICSITLAKGLKGYSTRGNAYVRDIQKMITQNDFQDFDNSSLSI